MMVQKQKRGIALILAGLCLLVLSFPFVSIDSGDGVMDSLRDGELVFKEGYSRQKEIVRPAETAAPAPAPAPARSVAKGLPPLPEGYEWEEVTPAPAPAPARSVTKGLPPAPKGYKWVEDDSAEPSYKERRIKEINARPDEIRIALPYKYFFAFNVIFIFIGIWLVVIHRVENASSKQ